MQAACLWWPGVVCALLACLVLSGCPITEAPEERAPASTPPFQGGTTPGGGPPPPTSTPPVLPTTCTGSDTQRDRCKGNTWQTCDLSTHLWKDFALCDSIGEVCSTAPRDCAGLVNTACCVTPKS